MDRTAPGADAGLSRRSLLAGTAALSTAGALAGCVSLPGLGDRSDVCLPDEDCANYWAYPERDAGNRRSVPAAEAPAGDLEAVHTFDATHESRRWPVVGDGMLHVAVRTDDDSVLSYRGYEIGNWAEAYRVEARRGFTAIAAPGHLLVLGEPSILVDTDAGEVVRQVESLTFPTVVNGDVVTVDRDPASETAQGRRVVRPVTMRARSLASWTETWTATFEAAPVGGRPAEAGDHLFVTGYEGALAVPVGGGEPAWRNEWPAQKRVTNVPPMTLDDGVLVRDIVADEGGEEVTRLHLLERADGSRRWTKRLPELARTFGFATDDERVYYGWIPWVVALDAASGEEVWSTGEPDPDRPWNFGSPTVVGDEVWVPRYRPRADETESHQRELLRFDAATGEVTAQQRGIGLDLNPVVAGGRLYSTWDDANVYA